jgi:exodeoxyribonuclease V alpha subunit
MTAPPLPLPVRPLAPFVAAGVLLDADLRLAERLGRIGGDRSEPVLLGVALALRGPRFGHVCVELAGIADRVAAEPPVGAGDRVAVAPDLGDLPWPEPELWTAALAASPLVRLPGAAGAPGAAGDAGDGAPLVLDGGRLYLDRYWGYERRLADALVRRAAERVEGVDPRLLGPWLDELFGEADGLDRQRLAAALAVLRRLTVIAGGPGTGKTHTVTRVLALLHRDALARTPDRPLRAALAAPTGKAAARLQDSLREGLGALTLQPAVRDALVRTPASTLHRLLGTSRESSTRFRHSAADPLPHDVVIVDEASMVSLPLMAKLVDAVRPDARLILLGDRDQLASVEAGAAFGDICGPAGSRPVLRLSAPAAAEVAAALGVDPTPHAERAPGPGVWDAIVRLDRFRRFGSATGLGAVATALQRADEDAEEPLALLRAGGDDVALIDPSDADARAACEAEVVDAYARYAALAVDGAEPGAVLDALDALRVLCALRRGPDGARVWNARVEAGLARRVPRFRPDQPWYVGRPILVTENDYGVRLYNGDVGVVLADPDDPARRRAVFRTTDGSLRSLSPARLPACETTFAMTIHKSQGSQFGHAVVVLPSVPSPILTRELVYTGITRARTRTTILATDDVLAEALRRPVQRATGLQDRLWRR